MISIFLDIDHISMKLKLKNIGCHKEREIVIPNTGLVRLDGQSGAGKSTIMNAIAFALFGICKKNIKTFGEKMSHISLIAKIKGESIKLKRQTNPTRFIVNNMEGDVAQTFINDLMGVTAEEFEASCYIRQKMQNSLLFMSPRERLEYIERIAFGDGQKPSAIKEKFIALSKERDVKHTECRVRHDDAMKQLNKIKKEYDEKFPNEITCPVEDIEKWEMEISNTSDILKKYQQEKKISESNIKLVEKLDILEKHYQNVKKQHDKKIAELNIELEKIGNIWINGNHEKINAKIQKYQTIIENAKLQNELESTKIDYQNIQKTEREKLEFAIKNTTDKLSKIIDVDDIYQKNISNQNELQNHKRNSDRVRKILGKNLQEDNVDEFIISLREKLESQCRGLHTEIQKINSDITELNHKEKILVEGSHAKICPVCNSSLKLNIDGSLIKIDKPSTNDCSLEDVQKNIKSLKNKCKNYEIQLSSINQQLANIQTLDDIDTKKYMTLSNYLTENDKISSTIKELSEQISNRKILESQLSELKSKNIDEDKLLLRLKIKIETLEKQLEKQSKKLTSEKKLTKINANDLNKKIQTLRDYIDNNIEKERQKNTIELRIKEENPTLNALEKEIEEIKSKNINLVTLNKKIQELEKQIDYCQSQIQTSLEIQKKIQLYQEYQIFTQKLEEQNVRCQKLHEKRQIAQQKYQAVITVIKLCTHAEVKSIEDTTDALTLCASRHIRSMFQTSPDPDVKVRLQTYRENKDGTIKPQINVQIEYRGNTIDDIHSVSGGEQDRMSLAYVLALNELFNSPILMLDECLSSLDSELNSDIIQKLEDYAKNKLILVVSHEANESLFGKTVKIDI